MKKTSIIIMTLLLVFILATGTVFAETSGQTVNLTVGKNTAQINGKDVTMTAPAQVVSGSTLVPLRFVGEAFGCDVQWDSSTRTATVILEDQIIEVPVGQTYAVINGVKTDVKVPGQLINGSTFVPLRFIGENLGAKVDYDAATRGISILLNTYKSETFGVEMVLPVGWTVDKETSEGIEMSYGTDCAVNISLIENKDSAINSDNFKTFADECFKEFASKEGFDYSVEDNGIANGVYTEDGLLCMIGYKLVDNGIVCTVIAAPVESVDEALARQCDIIINTQKTSAN